MSAVAEARKKLLAEQADLVRRGDPLLAKIVNDTATKKDRDDYDAILRKLGDIDLGLVNLS